MDRIDDGILTSAATANSLSALSSNGGSSASGAKSRAPAAALTELSQVQVRFFTRQSDLPSVPDTFLTVPVKLARYGLSEIVNALTNQDPPQPFDFLINGRFLRSDLLKYLQRSGASAEAGLELEYVAAAPEPTSERSRPHPDWIASVDARGGRGAFIVSGCYDSVVRVWDASDAKAPAIALGLGHQSAVKSVAVMRRGAKQEGEKRTLDIVSGSKDRAVKLWKFTEGSSRLSCVADCVAHTESVEAVAVAEGTEKFASGGWDNQICLWDVTNADTAIAAEEAPQSKKRKTAASSSSAPATPSFSPLHTLQGHTGAVTALVYPHPSTLYSGSMDHHLKQWDASRGALVHTFLGRTPVTCLDFSIERNMLVSGHHDSTLRVWDPRINSAAAAEKELLQSTLKSHKGWVSAVRFAPDHAHQLASASYDNTVKIWDLRAALPLFTISVHTDKLLTLDWMDATHLWSGGADSQLQTHTVGRA